MKNYLDYDSKKDVAKETANAIGEIAAGHIDKFVKKLLDKHDLPHDPSQLKEMGYIVNINNFPVENLVTETLETQCKIQIFNVVDETHFRLRVSVFESDGDGEVVREEKKVGKKTIAFPSVPYSTGGGRGLPLRACGFVSPAANHEPMNHE